MKEYKVSKSFLDKLKEESKRKKVDAYEAGYTEALEMVHKAILEQNKQ
jgi:hypothetical protein